MLRIPAIALQGASALLCCLLWNGSASAMDAQMQVSSTSLTTGQTVRATVSGKVACTYQVRVLNSAHQAIESLPQETKVIPDPPRSYDFKMNNPGQYIMEMAVIDTASCGGISTGWHIEVPFTVKALQAIDAPHPLSLAPSTPASTKAPCKKVSKPGVSIDTCEK